MIARLKEVDQESAHRRNRLMWARKAVAATLLKARAGELVVMVPLVAWKSWLLAAWMVLCTAFFFVRMTGVLHW